VGNISTVLINAPSGLKGAQLKHLMGQEGISQLFHYEIEVLIPFGEEKPDIAALVGKTLTVKITGDNNVIRYFHGFITEAVELMHGKGFYRYSYVLRPELWFRSQNRLNRIYHDKSVPDIIKDVLGDKLTVSSLLKSDNYKPLEYCVQYQESDFNFICRLMEGQDIYYFFRHSESGHQLVIADSDTREVHQLIKGCESMASWFADGEGGQATVQEWQSREQWKADTAIAIDFDFTQAMNRESGVGMATSGEGEFVWIDYPAGEVSHTGIQDYASRRWRSWNAGTRSYKGKTRMPGVTAGGVIAVNDPVDNTKTTNYLIAELLIQVNASESAAGACNHLYHSEFSLQEKDKQFFPPRITSKPKIAGYQTAFVTGDGEEKLCVDEFGRIKVQFHWNQNDECSCWARVSQPIAGDRWGSLFLPRVGQEVVVVFLDGDPDRPLVIGGVYNSGMMPPYLLSGSKSGERDDQRSRSGIRSSSLGNNDISNELRFDDKEGAEQFLLRAGRNRDDSVANDALEWVGNERHLWVKKSFFSRIEGDEHRQVDGDVRQQIGQEISLQVNGKGDCKIQGDLALMVGKLDLRSQSSLVMEAGSSLTLKAGSSTLVMGAEGVFMNGVEININAKGLVKLNSGGSGSVAKPEDPKIVTPISPREADDGSH